MSQSDSFIDEVTEEVRRERLFKLMRRYGWIAILLVVLIVAGAAWNEYRKAQDAAEAQALGDALMAALQQGDANERVTALAAVPAQTQSQQAILAMLAAAESAQAGDAALAADRLNEVATMADLPQVYRDLARFKALGLQDGDLEPAELRAGYEALARPGSGFRLLAEEQIALTYVAEGDTDAAIETLQAILADAEVSGGVRQRASQLMVALGADPAGPMAGADDGTGDGGSDGDGTGQMAPANPGE